MLVTSQARHSLPAFSPTPSSPLLRATLSAGEGVTGSGGGGGAQTVGGGPRLGREGWAESGAPSLAAASPSASHYYSISAL